MPRTLRLALWLGLLLAPAAASAQAPSTASIGAPPDAQAFVPLWPDGEMPNSRGLAVEDSVARERIFRVATPGMFAFFPSAEENRGSAVVIFPSGGYHHLTYVLGGIQLARWFNTLGMSAFVVTYRLPNSPDLEDRALGPQQDAQRAMKLVRANAATWGIDPERVGAFGASAGGHLVTTIGTHAEDVSQIGDAVDAERFAPDFMLLVSPVIDMGELTHAGSRDNLLGPDPTPEQVAAYSNQTRVTATTPPAFLAHAADDTAVPAMNSVLFFEALTAHDVPASLHVFPSGGHAIGLRNNPGSTDLWTALCEAWLGELGFLPAPPFAP